MNGLEKLRTFMYTAAMSSVKITNSDITDLSGDEVDEFNKLLDTLRSTLGFEVDFEFGVYEARRVIGHIFGGAPDARQATTSAVTDGGPFRRRYRALEPREVAHHDRIKDAATELWTLINDIHIVRDKGPATTTEAQVLSASVSRDMALARTALEDSVMRAVRALTA